MTNAINFPEHSKERSRKFRNPDFAEPVVSRQSKREVVCSRTLQAIMAEAPDEIRRIESGVSTPDQLARPALQEVVASPEIIDFPRVFPAVSNEGVVADTVQSHDNVAFLSDARARVEAYYQDGSDQSNQENAGVTGLKAYLEQHPRVSSTPDNTQRPVAIHPSADTTANYYSQSNVYPLTHSQQGSSVFQNPNAPTDFADNNLRATSLMKDQNVAA